MAGISVRARQRVLDVVTTKREASRISSVCAVTSVFSILRKIKYFLLFSRTHRFVVLPPKTVRKSQARIAVAILRHDLDHTCYYEMLHRIKDTLMTDCETNRISSMCEITKVVSIFRRIKTFVLFTTTNRFVVLPLKTVHKSQARIPITILRYDLDHRCSSEILHRIKGKTKDWMHRWQRGDLCYVAFMDTEPIGHIWICDGEWRLKDEDEGRSLPQRSVFLYDALTCEKWRGNGVYQALISMSVTDLISKGYKNLYMLVDDRNLPAQHAPEKLGFRRTEHYIRLYRCLKVFNYRRDVVSLMNGC